MTEPTVQDTIYRGAESDQELTWRNVGQALRHWWSRLGRVTTDRRVMWGLLAVILLLGAVLRLTGLDWDDGQHLHPDERFLTMVENALEWPQSLKEYWDTSLNPLNPYNRGQGMYVYGLSPVVVAKFLGQISDHTGYSGVYLAGRAMSAVMDLLCVLLIFLIGRRLYDARVGLLGALLLSLTALDIQQSHYFTVDTSTTFYVTLALYFAVRVAQGEGWGSILGLGIAFGLAVSAKISVLSFLLIIGLAYLLRMAALWADKETGLTPARTLMDVRGRLGRLWMSFKVEAEDDVAPATKQERLFLHAMRVGASALAVLVVAVLAFRIAQPQAFMGPGFLGLKINPQWMDDMKRIQRLVSGQDDYPPSHQWTAREPVWYMLKNLLLWGMGLPLGLAVWASWGLMAYELYKKHKWEHLLVWAWMTFTFFYQSVQFVKAIRYLLPIYPTMALVGAYGLVRLWDGGRAALRRAGGIWQKWGAYGSLGLVGLVLAGTAFWAFAFTGIYTRPVTRIAASRWIYQNIPPGATISFEVWDDPLPLNVDGHNASIEYNQIKMDPYWEDIPEKQQALYQWIDQTEYIALSSNRLYESIPRLPMRYPMTTRYYEALFSGELGYDRLITFTSRPRLFGIEINDDNSDESFTVYDHPKVIIFKKRADFSLANAMQILGGYDLEHIVRVTPKQVSSAPNNLMLDDQAWQAQQQGGTWSELFNRDCLVNKVPTLVWLLVLTLLGVIAFPLGFVAFRRLRDRGYILSKTLGLLLVGYFSWLLPSLKVLPFTRWTIAGVLVGLAVISAAVAWRQREALRDYLRARWRLLAANELLFLGFFLLFWFIRRANPDLWHPAMGGEKPMDFAYLNAIIKSTYFPPYDPWFAGGYINYYYLGLAMVATLVKFTGIIPSISYNLAIPTFFAMTAMGASCVAFNLIPAGDDEEGWWPRALRFGVVGALLVAVVGNLGEVKLLVNGLQSLGSNVSLTSSIPGLAALVRLLAGLWALLFKGQQLPFRPEWWYWNASRIMQNGEINEFPFFTFLYADLHAHLTAMPFALLALGAATSFVAQPVAALSQLARNLRPQIATDGGAIEALPRRVAWQQAVIARARAIDWALVWQMSLLALAVGELWANNSWDFPTYLGISMAALAIGAYADRGRIDEQSVAQFIRRAAYVAVLSALFYWPFHSHFGTAYTSVEPWKGERTTIGAYLLIHGATLFMLVSYLIAVALEPGTRNGIVRAARLFFRHTGRWSRARYLYNLLVRRQTMGYEFGWAGIIFLGFILALLLLAKNWVLFLALPLLVLAVGLLFSRRASPARRITMLLIAVGVALTIGVEYIVIKGDIGRMNTVFKFYLQVWILWGIAAAVGLAYLFGKQRQWSWPGARLWRAALAVLLVGVALYPIFATYGKARDRWNPSLPGGLDGMRYMPAVTYADNGRNLPLVDDWLAITWLQDHVVGSPVIAEANSPEYRWGDRVSIYTGLPTIVGWNWHQKQQRMAVGGIVVDWRQQDLANLYNTTDVILTRTILRRYQVGYIYVGELERAYYSAEGLAKFDQMVGTDLEFAYRAGTVTIYRVRGSGAREVNTSANRQSGHGLFGWIAKNWIPSTVQAQGPQAVPSNKGADPIKASPLMLDTPVDQLPVLRDRGWNRLVSGNTLLTILCWWLVLEMVGLAAWPLAARVVPHFHDYGYGLAKGLGLVIVSYLVWISASLRLTANSPPVAWGAVAALGVGSFFLWRRRRRARAHRPETLAVRAIERQRARRLIWLEEGLFSLAFLAFVGLRLLNPDLWQPWFGGEKMMEIAILNALTKSAYMPPYDPYFAGGYLNYYYYGQFIAALLMKLTGITPEVGFNLAVPTFFALTVSHVFVVGYHFVALAGRRLSPPPVKARSHPSQRAFPLPAGESLERVTVDGEGTEGAILPDGGAMLPDGGAILRDGGGAEAGTQAMAVASLSRAGLWAGGLAAMCVAVIGNLSGTVQALEGIASAGGSTFPDGRVALQDIAHFFLGLERLITGRAQTIPFDYWYRGTRIIPYTINEFPFFSFLFADLHPHMISIPFTVLVLALFLGLATDHEKDTGRAALRWVVLALSVGVLGVINTWDLPAYLGMLGLIMLYRGYRRGRARGILAALPSFLLLGLASLLLYAPFYAHYQAQQLGLALVPPAERAQPGPFLLIWGMFLFLAVSVLGLWLAQSWPWRRWMRLARRLGWAEAWRRAQALGGARVWLWPASVLLLVTGAGVGLILVGRGMAVIGLLLALLVAAGTLLVAGRKSEAEFLQRLLLFVGLGILLGVEIVYLKDFLATSEWRRMNTVFKFYIQAWVLLGLALGSALPAVWRWVSSARALGEVWRGVCGLLMAATLVYVIMAIPARVNERFPGGSPARGTLDGTAYMWEGVYDWPSPDTPISLPYDRQAIEWLWRNVQGTPVIAEAAIGFYREGGLRVSSYTGLPTLLGAHEWEQRPADQVSPQGEDARMLYETTDIGTLQAIVQRYRVRYIYVGQLERAVYPAPGLEKFASLAASGQLERVYHNERVDIYRVADSWSG